MFNEIIRIARDCTPRIIFLENVSALLTINGGRDFGYCLAELDAIGYDAQWHCVPASHVGAPHRRDRIWIVAYPASESANRYTIGKKTSFPVFGNDSEDVSNALPSGERREQREGKAESDIIPNSEPAGLEGQREDAGEPAQPEPGDGGSFVADTELFGSVLSESAARHREKLSEGGSIARPEGNESYRSSQWNVEPTLGSLAYGLSAGLDVAGLGEEYIRVATKILERTNQLKALGNAVVPQVVAYVAENVVRPIIKEGERL